MKVSPGVYNAMIPLGHAIDGWNRAAIAFRTTPKVASAKIAA